MFRSSKRAVTAFIAVAASIAIFACATTQQTIGIEKDAGAGQVGFDNDGGGTPDTPAEAGPGIFTDAAPPDGSSCVPDAGGPGPVGRFCLLPTDNECDGLHDLATYPANGTGGNGFDDDCDGLVDEGCSCDGAGLTKPCFLVPASQTFGGVPVGWCAQNSKGTVDCLKPSTEFAGTWSGQCRGAQPPFADDFCANGDFNCDGKEQNSKANDCSCKGDQVQCPTDPIEMKPFPAPSQLPTKIDAAGWFVNGGNVANATNWKWTLRGGDCDNILPHPTFAMFATQDGTGTTAGSQVDTLGPSGKEHGLVATAPAITSSFYPAFSLSGDYLVEGEFDLNGQHYSCQQKVQVRAPGIRAELCWDTMADDIDLHMAQTTFGNQCANKGWWATCPKQDCYFSNCKGSSSGPNWFPATANSDACKGWGSLQAGSCTNPRLDRDNLGTSTCSPSVTNPNSSDFCGPENINVDNPTDGSKFAVSVNFWGGSTVTHPHVNIYCNGERVVSTGYNPVTGNGAPMLVGSGGQNGDTWKVALITSHVDAAGKLDCTVDPVPSQHPRPATDVSNAYCVDRSADGADALVLFTPGGQAPLDAEALCFH
jgi:hypothetical protein